MPAAALRNTPREEISVAAGTLVRMAPLIKRKKIGKISEVSLAEVGHALARGVIIVDASDNPIPALQLPIRRKPGSKIEYTIMVYDPGPQYRVCFDPKAPPQHAMVQKE